MDDVLTEWPMVEDSAGLIDGAVIVAVEEHDARQPGGPWQALPAVVGGGIGDELGSLRREMIGADQKCLLADRIPHQVIGVRGQHPGRTVEVVGGGTDIGRFGVLASCY